MSPKEQELALAIASMTAAQLWALRVAVMTERRLRTHSIPVDDQTAMRAAQAWALANA
jgi:hypothetical protein